MSTKNAKKNAEKSTEKIRFALVRHPHGEAYGTVVAAYGSRERAEHVGLASDDGEDHWYHAVEVEASSSKVGSQVLVLGPVVAPEGEEPIERVEVGRRLVQRRDLRSEPVELLVGPKCEVDHGYWYCASHDQTFLNQFEKDSHVGDYSGFEPNTRHQLAWLCVEHGAEVP